ncbi:lyase family protein [Streptomyces monticola]|uniref:Lyase family protein n=1 Tax=Streptomyces monticola TaxID=2666263 RepID=A0ABW2JTG0_9ACTN
MWSGRSGDPRDSPPAARPAGCCTDSGLLSTVRAGAPVESVVGDEAWLQAMLDTEAALARAQARLGLIPGAAADVIGKVAYAGDFDLVSLARRAREAANPVVALVADLTGRVASADPAAAEHVHRGSTSQDIMDSAAMLVAARALDVVLEDLSAVAAALARLAAEHRDTVMPGRTLTQHAVPTTFGLKAAGWMCAVEDAARRLEDARNRLPAQLGGAAGTLAAYHEFAMVDERADRDAMAGREEATGRDGATRRAGGTGRGGVADRDGATGRDEVTCRDGVTGRDEVTCRDGVTGRDGAMARGGARGRCRADVALSLADLFADELGLARPVLPWHTARAPFMSLGSELALAAGVLGKFGLDVQNLARTEIAEAVEPAADGRGASSAMPQKRNPVLSSLLVSAALQVPSHTATLTHCMLAQDERPGGAWQAEWQPLREALRVTGGAAHLAVELARGLTPVPQRMARNLGATDGQIVAERLAVRLTAALGKSRAKRCVGRIAAAAAERDVPFSRAVAADAEVSAALSSEVLAELLDPRGYVGVAGALVDRALGRGRS